MMRIIKRCIGFLLIMIGLFLYFYPIVSTRYLVRETEEYIRDYDSKKLTENKSEDSVDECYEAIQAYNSMIYEQGQAGFVDAWALEQAPVELTGFEDGRYGYIEIPAMDIKLALYIGASAENMTKGAAILGQTSIPIGEANSNSVIAGHRGYNGIPYFREIENLNSGDPIYVTNPWETLTYCVKSIKIIDPEDVDAVKIQEGKDMITLLTCHPYRSHGKYRYVVYCVRDEGNVFDDEQSTEVISTIKEYRFESSKEDIERENLLRKTCGLILLFGFLVCFLRNYIGN